MRYISILFFLVLSLAVQAQKKPLDHTVYDNWQSFADRAISNDGKYVAYAINPQEGDGVLVLQSVQGGYKVVIPRGAGVVLSEDSKYAVCRIKPTFVQTRDAKIKKKKPDEMPKDSLAIIKLGDNKVVKIPRLKSFKLPDDAGGWLAYLLDKEQPEAPKTKATLDSAAKIKSMFAMADSLVRAADSIRLKATNASVKGMAVLQTPAAPAKVAEEITEEGTTLVLMNLNTGAETKYTLVSDFYFNKKGTALVLKKTKKNAEAGSAATIVKVDLSSMKATTILTKFNDAKLFRMDEAGKQLAFVAERDSSAKALRKFYQLYYYADGKDSAVAIANQTSKGVPAGHIISDNQAVSFSKSGSQLFFGTAPLWPLKDTSLPEFDRVSVDIWHYNDDQIMPMQLRSVETELKRAYTARYDFKLNAVVPLGSTKFRNVIQTNDGDGSVFYAATDEGKRIASQWQGYTKSDIYTINPIDGNAKLIKANLKSGNVQPSVSGNLLLYYDEPAKKYFVYNHTTGATVQIAKDITAPLYDEENDVPDDPNAYGVMRWTENDQYVLLYDRFDIWQVDPLGKQKSICLTGGRANKISYRFIATDLDQKFVKTGDQLLLRVFDEKDKTAGLATLVYGTGALTVLFKEKVALSPLVQKAKDADVLLYTKESYVQSPALYASSVNGGNVNQLATTNAQQINYNWGNAELFTWKAYTGKIAEGILYKPENFDATKKYPMIVYFYERNNQTLYNYIPPAPTASRLNISFFVSRGYVVLVPDIWYKTGYPGQGAYDYILSGTRAVVKQGYIDSTKIGLQGQSWGGYQIAHLITRTNLYAAAWAGAPVVNMTSAYGGIRWGPGMNRQFQYEKTQSRIGATLWEKPNLYIENSALFHLPKVTTPLVIMANDADDAVPWYQGIEFYTAMRRLGKKVWMLNYNNEAHNLVERKNRKDIQIREQQFFDYLLKGEKPAPWISNGVPATMKGRDWGLQ
ncbi:MAG: prolyl oligopeptidase family serine peptidase [Bacteroidetes bacterium]|nr:prolyl oligopeptidase family serine peptidase [Bacteroidota bacterium]